MFLFSEKKSIKQQLIIGSPTPVQGIVSADMHFNSFVICHSTFGQCHLPWANSHMLSCHCLSPNNRMSGKILLEGIQKCKIGNKIIFQDVKYQKCIIVPKLITDPDVLRKCDSRSSKITDKNKCRRAILTIPEQYCQELSFGL